ncbi:unnamed protein product [Allacma fusca]|uniref:Phosphatidylinositol 3-kinase n=1 Tax=Allacma fusca TaxID=39272 RepID=A0A8J2PCT0_9HEXA|nr:unnamed protein product [Allacma fusca]
MPCSSGELWGHHLMPQKIELDILLPNGVVMILKCARDQTLQQVKNLVWREGPKYPYFHLISAESDYVFTSVTSDAKKEEFHDETRRLCDLHLFVPFLKLVEPNASTRQESILNSQISVALGIPVNQLDELEVPEVISFRRDAINLCEEILDVRERTPENRAMYAYCAELDRSTNHSLFDSYFGGLVILKVWLSPTYTITVKVHLEANADTVVRETLDSSAKKIASLDNSNKQCSDYVLKICSRQEYLLGSFPITQYKYIRDAVRREEIPQLEFVERRVLYDKLPTEPFHIPAYYRRTYRTSENELPLTPQPDVHLWKLVGNVRVQILWATFINATDNICVKAAVFHGDEQISSTQETASIPNKNPRWNETLTFDLPNTEIPRSARLCVSLCTVTRSKKKQEEFCMIAWGNVNLFDFRGLLISGKVRLDLWPPPMSVDSMIFHPLGVTGSSLDSEGASLQLEFDRYTGPIFYPAKSEIYDLALLADRYEAGKVNDDTTPVVIIHPRPTEKEIATLRDLVERDPLCEVSEQDRIIIWKHRKFCSTELPGSLPRLVGVVKWSCRETVAQFYELLRFWPAIPMNTALSLLDCKTADIYVREFAVRNLDASLPDSDVLDLLLQLVQSLKYEPYLQSTLIMFLLRRALNNRLIGHYFFWHLRSEISGKSWLDMRFSLILEAYCRGLCGHLKDLNKQVEALEKLTMLTDTLKERRDDAPRDRLKFLTEQIRQADFLEVLENLNSPISPCLELGSLKVESCRIMDSAKRPLWLVWNNNDSLANTMGVGETAAIFKNGDDLRQDMLTLQVLRVMDEFWWMEGLDLKLITYTCLPTGKQVGLIQVVPNAQTVYTIQRRSTLSAIQVNSKQLHKFIQEKNKSEAQYLRAIDIFTRSCAGYCVATFILGIGDRNPDNIMISEEGNIFHIDFGHFLGHFKKKFGINRERVPFVLTEDFLYVIAKGAENPRKSPEFQEFQKLCGRAYLIIRRHANLLISLFTLMLPTGIPELQSISDVDYLRKTLAVDMSEAEALNYFQTM